MKVMKSHTAAALCSLAIAGCASTGESPLIFGQTNTLGISVGASATDQGGDLILGYKGQNFAIVPVSVGQPDGSSAHIGAAVGQDFSDAYSVLGQFEAKSKSGATTQSAGLGTFFATGLAAKRLADGFAQKMGDRRTTTSTECGGLEEEKPATDKPPTSDTKANQTTGDSQSQPTAKSTQEDSSTQQSAVSGAAAKERRPDARLVYAQYQSVGFIATAAATQQGADLTLGYKDRNIAIVPTITRDGAGVASPIEAKATADDGKATTHLDALSVLGQFEFEGQNNAGTIDVGLGKFFSTGMAAKRLSDGFATKLCGQNQVAQKPAPNQ